MLTGSLLRASVEFGFALLSSGTQREDEHFLSGRHIEIHKDVLDGRGGQRRDGVLQAVAVAGGSASPMSNSMRRGVQERLREGENNPRGR